ncbi:galactokinase [Planoprotostelium fungivorum]|uniref:Galactokinase n=1 Tax=Planoprotostelium fungivorum TaxID=1890364 RepID=A0A2P6NJ17_9EUKA|nr:galactokinase [Planoprotostelium fungivorum]
MGAKRLEGLWLNKHIIEQLEECTTTSAESTDGSVYAESVIFEVDDFAGVKIVNNRELALKEQFKARYHADATSTAYAPGRVEVLGNHTDYNEGYVLSAAIDTGTFSLASLSDNDEIKIFSVNFNEEITFSVSALKDEYEGGKIVKTSGWCNYVKGVLIKILERKNKEGGNIKGLNFLFDGDLPLGLGLSSSAALEISSGLCLSNLYQIKLNSEELAKIAQWSEHNYAGAKCGLLDQISSIHGKKAHLVKTDFRTLKVENVPLHESLCFLICNTGVSHSLVASEYNERRISCESAATHLNDCLSHDVTHLRDVTWEQLGQHADKLDEKDPKFSMRARHIVGENERVIEGQKLLQESKWEEFGKLMFQSHESSQNHFENSCKELDQVVDIARSIPHVLGARLSGGGFGGAALLLIESKYKDEVKKAVEEKYKQSHQTTVEVSVIVPSDGALLFERIDTTVLSLDGLVALRRNDTREVLRVVLAAAVPHQMASLADLVHGLSEAAKREILYSTIVFPKTESLQDDKPSVVISQASLDLNAVKSEVETHPELISLSAVQDVSLTLDSLLLIQEELHLEQFDSIQIYRGGVDLLCIKNTTRDVGRSAYVEINDYRRRIRQTLLKRADHMQTAMIVLSTVALTYIIPA